MEQIAVPVAGELCRDIGGRLLNLRGFESKGRERKTRGPF